MAFKYMDFMIGYINAYIGILEVCKLMTRSRSIVHNTSLCLVDAVSHIKLELYATQHEKLTWVFPT